MKEHIKDNAAHIADNTELIQHINDLVTLYGPILTVGGVLIGFIIGLLIWAWKRLENTQAKMEVVFTKHVEENDKLHNTLFSHIRETDEKLNHLLGEHEAQHGGRH